MPGPYGVIVIGGGPGGYVAALRASQLGANVALIEKTEVGGTCLQRGCIPSKALLSSAELFHKVKHQAKSFGVTVDPPELSLGDVLRRKNKVVRQLTLGLQSLLKHRNVEVVRGRARLRSANEVEVTPSEGPSFLLQTARIILATGSEPSLPSFIPFDGKTVITSNEALEIKAIGTAPVAKLHVIRDNKYVFSTEPGTAEVNLRFADDDARPGQTHYYYIRVEQADGNLAWASPMWITYK